MRELNSTRVQKQETIQDLMILLVLSELDLLTVYLSLDLGLLYQLFIILHLRSFTLDSHHFVQVHHFHGKSLRSLPSSCWTK